MPRIELEEVSLRYLQEGKGPDIVWVPGGDGTCEFYAEQIAAFREDFRNTTFDPRGAGETVCRKAPPWSVADFAADCAALIRARCDPPVFLTGLSMGGLITQQVALDFPDLVRCAIPMGTCAKATGFTAEWMQAEVDFRRTGGTLSVPFAAAHYAAFCYPAEVLGDPEKWSEVRDRFQKKWKDRDVEMMAGQWQACIDFDCSDRLPNCRVPLHVVAFEQDLQTPPQLARAVAELAPDGHFHLLPGMGHTSMRAHKPEAVNTLIRQIIKQYL